MTGKVFPSFYVLNPYLLIWKKNVFLHTDIKSINDMEAITFSPAQIHVFNLVSHIRSAIGLEQLREQLTSFYAKQVDDEMDSLWENGKWDEKKLEELRGSHFRTPYNK